ncbi:amidase family protein [Streptomyces sp. NPDC059786]|uniref:amidase family protein n=1 Tax=Streptomyces sp. NPDC059786 TaxID=3346946 RepID=UPI00364AFA98
MTDWTGRTATETAAAVREGRVTPREVVAGHLARIERLDARIGAFRKVRAEAALAEADALAARPDLAGLPLAGVPVAVKDNLAVRGESTRNGSAATPDEPAADDHVTVARLRAAGAVVVGLTNVPELVRLRHHGRGAGGPDPKRLVRRTRVHAALGRRFVAGVRDGERRARPRRLLEPFFAEHDVLLTPALARRGPVAAPWHERGRLRNMLANTACSPLTPPWNLTGRPALSVPFGTLPSGAPCAVQLVGRPGSEHALLDVAARLESLRPWRRTAPVTGD